MGNLRRKATIRRRKNNNKNNINKMKYAFSSKTQKMGPGKKLLNIDREVVGQNGAIGLTFNEIISGNEFATTLDNFNLIKVKSIQVVGFPNDAANNKPTYINLDCFGDINSDNIGQSERTKIMYNDTKRPVYFNYRLPGIMKNAQKINSWIPREFFLDIMNLISLKVITPDTNEEVRLRVVVRCEFRVPRITAINNRIEVRHTASDLNKMSDCQYKKRFEKDDLEKIFVKKEKKSPKLKLEENELNYIENKDLSVAAEQSLEETNKTISGESEIQRSEVQEQGKNKKKNRKKKEKKKEKKLNEKQTPDVKKKVKPDFHSLIEKERQMVREEQLKEDAKEIPSEDEGKVLHNKFYNMYYKIRNCETPYKSFVNFERDLDDWKESDELVGEVLYTYEPEDYDNPTLRRFIYMELREVAKKRGYNDIF